MKKAFSAFMIFMAQEKPVCEYRIGKMHAQGLAQARHIRKRRMV
jgi:hypothetical protein